MDSPLDGMLVHCGYEMFFERYLKQERVYIIMNFSCLLNNFACRCVSSEKKYGPPVSCEQCKLSCAFEKPMEARDKVLSLFLSTTCNY